MSMQYPARRPGTVTLVMVLTWIVAILTITSGVLFLLADASALLAAGLSRSEAKTYGVVEIVLGVVIALVAVGLGNGNSLARFLVSLLMVLRIGVAVWAAVIMWGHVGFWSVVAAGVVALLVLVMLWTAKASAFFATH